MHTGNLETGSPTHSEYNPNRLQYIILPRQAVHSEESESEASGYLARDKKIEKSCEEADIYSHFVNFRVYS